MNRRAALQALSSGAVATVAGCAGIGPLGSETATETDTDRDPDCHCGVVEPPNGIYVANGTSEARTVAVSVTRSDDGTRVAEASLTIRADRSAKLDGVMESYGSYEVQLGFDDATHTFTQSVLRECQDYYFAYQILSATTVERTETPCF